MTKPAITPIFSQTLDGGIHQLMALPDGQGVLVGMADGQVQYVPRYGGAQIRYTHAAGCQAMALLGEGRFAFTVGLEGGLGRIDFFESTWQMKKLVPQAIQAIIALKQGKDKGGGKVMVAAGRRIWAGDCTDVAQVFQSVYETTSVISSLIALPGVKGFAAAHAHGLTLFETDSLVASKLQPSRQLPAPGACLEAAISPDGRFAAAALHDQSVHIWETKSGRDWTMHGFLRRVKALAFSPQSEILAMACGADICLWDLRGEGPGGRAPAEFMAHRADVRSICFFPDGKHFVSAGDDGMALLWSVRGEGKPGEKSFLEGRLKSAFPGDAPIAALALGGVEAGKSVFWCGDTSGFLRLFPC